MPRRGCRGFSDAAFGGRCYGAELRPVPDIQLALFCSSLFTDKRTAEEMKLNHTFVAKRCGAGRQATDGYAAGLHGDESGRAGGG